MSAKCPTPSRNQRKTSVQRHQESFISNENLKSVKTKNGIFDLPPPIPDEVKLGTSFKRTTSQKKKTYTHTHTYSQENEHSKRRNADRCD